ncbi:hypothetical protein BMR85_016720 [Achromobacter sp. KAs 3-5]|nr:hypothetical protein BMR85_016720 [Achromobacter sp. KAs 3-5]
MPAVRAMMLMPWGRSSCSIVSRSSWRSSPSGRRRAGGLLEQVDGGVGAQQFGARRTQPAGQRQTEGCLIKADGVFEIGNINIDQDSHGGLLMVERRVVTRPALKNLLPRP